MYRNVSETDDTSDFANLISRGLFHFNSKNETKEHERKQKIFGCNKCLELNSLYSNISYLDDASFWQIQFLKAFMFTWSFRVRGEKVYFEFYFSFKHIKQCFQFDSNWHVSMFNRLKSFREKYFQLHDATSNIRNVGVLEIAFSGKFLDYYIEKQYLWKLHNSKFRHFWDAKFFSAYSKFWNFNVMQRKLK